MLWSRIWQCYFGSNVIRTMSNVLILKTSKQLMWLRMTRTVYRNFVKCFPMSKSEAAFLNVEKLTIFEISAFFKMFFQQEWVQFNYLEYLCLDFIFIPFIKIHLQYLLLKKLRKHPVVMKVSSLGALCILHEKSLIFFEIIFYVQICIFLRQSEFWDFMDEKCLSTWSVGNL